MGIDCVRWEISSAEGIWVEVCRKVAKRVWRSNRIPVAAMRTGESLWRDEISEVRASESEE